MIALSLALLLSAARGPPTPPDALEGDIVEVNGEVYQVVDGLLYTLDDPVLNDARYTVTVTGSQLDKNRHDKVVRTDAITNEDIKRIGARTLADVLEQQAGMQVGSSVGLGQQVSVDGLDGRHVLILINGKPVTGRVNNRVDVGRIPVSAATIERIEIVRGPMSALYGSEALGGVINIITKNPKLDPGAEVNVFTDVLTGSFSSGAGLHLWGGLEPVAGRLDVDIANLAPLDRGGSFEGQTVMRPDGRDDVPARRQLSFNGEAAVPLFDVASLHVNANASQQTSSARLAPTLPFLDRSRNGEVQGRAGVAVDLTDDTDVLVDLTVTRFRHVFEKVPRGSLLPGDGELASPFCGAAAWPFLDGACPSEPAVRTDAIADSARLEARINSDLIARLPVSLPIDIGALSTSVGALVLTEQARRVNGDGDDTLPGGGVRDSAAGYAEVLWQPQPWLSFMPGIRVDAFTPATDDGGNFAVGPKVSTKVDLPLGFFTRASYGRGFRLPSFEERFLRFDHSELGYIVEGNPDLAPEVNNGARAEVGFSTGPTFSLSVEGYLNMIDNLITERVEGRDDQGIPIFSYANAARAYTSGINTRANIGPFFGLSFDVTYQYLINAVDATGCPEDNPYFCSIDDGARSLPLRPTHSAASTLRYQVDSTSTRLFTRGNYTSARPLNFGEEAPQFFLLAAGVQQSVFEMVDLTLSVENLLDTYHPVYGPKPGRRVNLQVVVRAP